MLMSGGNATQKTLWTEWISFIKAMEEDLCFLITILVSSLQKMVLDVLDNTKFSSLGRQ